MIHNNFEHILINTLCQIFFGITLEMTNESWRIAIVYISGIFLGGLLRETFSSHNNPLAGASGKLITIPLQNMINTKYCLYLYGIILDPNSIYSRRRLCSSCLPFSSVGIQLAQ